MKGLKAQNSSKQLDTRPHVRPYMWQPGNRVKYLEKKTIYYVKNQPDKSVNCYI